MNKKLSLLALLSFFVLKGFGQFTREEGAVKEVIDRLFKGMELADSAVVRSTFASEATMVSVFRDKNNAPVLKRDASIDGFLKAIAAPHPEPYYEAIWNLKILIDGDLAQAWCDYGFYIGKKFSHCGVDAFHLHKGKEGWKIFHLADTRRKTGCDIPPEIQDKRK